MKAYRCRNCTAVFSEYVDYQRHSCDKVKELLNMQIPLELTVAFKNPGSKTLKLEVKTGVKLEDAVKNAYGYVDTPDSTYTRVEFKYGSCYIVVAKLKDKE
jgi:autonomous glycyl radical cofactor GrcA